MSVINLEYRPAEWEQYGTLLQLLREQTSDYLPHTLALMGVGWSGFSQFFRTVGQVVGIYRDGELAGFYWIELRETVLHLHALILKDSHQRRGIGTEVLRALEERHADRAEVIEVGVHQANQRARRLYAKLGYVTINTLGDLGFEVMQKRLSPMA